MTVEAAREEILQTKLTESLENLRRRAAVELVEVYEAYGKLPRLEGEKNTPTLAGERRVSKDDGAFTLLSSMIGIPGLSEMANFAADVALDMFGNRKATRMRPQDTKPYNAKQQAYIKDKKAQLIKQLQKLAEKIDLVDAMMSCGHKTAAIINGKLIPLEEAASMVMKPSERFKAQHKPNANGPAMPAPRLAA